MKKLILITATLFTFAFQAKASNPECVPTKSVEQATADYNTGVQALNANLAAEDAAAVALLQQKYDAALAAYNEHVQYLYEQVQKEIAVIQHDANPGWQQAIEVAIARYNENVLVAQNEYYAKTDAAAANYNATTEQSRVNFNQQAVKLADDYNHAVCAAQ